jgi:hypothetical protein
MPATETGAVVREDVRLSVDAIRVDDAVVCARPGDIDTFGLRFVGTQVEIVDQIPSMLTGCHEILLTTDAATTADFLRSRAAVASALGIITPVLGEAWREGLAACARNGLAVSEVTVDGPLVHLRIEAGGTTSRPLSQMLERWLEERARSVELVSGNDEAVNGLVHLIHVVEKLQIEPSVPVPAAAPDAALRGAVTARDRRIEVLTRRYEALSGSKLGRLTLAWWQFRGRRRQSDD